MQIFFPSIHLTRSSEILTQDPVHGESPFELDFRRETCLLLFSWGWKAYIFPLLIMSQFYTIKSLYPGGKPDLMDECIPCYST